MVTENIEKILHFVSHQNHGRGRHRSTAQSPRWPAGGTRRAGGRWSPRKCPAVGENAPLHNPGKTASWGRGGCVHASWPEFPLLEGVCSGEVLHGVPTWNRHVGGGPRAEECATCAEKALGLLQVTQRVQRLEFPVLLPPRLFLLPAVPFSRLR